MRPVWKGAVSFGLVNIPVKMYAASEDKSIKFKYLHSKCNTPLKYQRTCPRCNQEVEWPEIVRGYEYQKDRFVVMRDEDFESIPTEKTRTIDILDFCRLAEIDPIYYEKSYYLGPEETGKKAYNLLVSALKNTDRVAVAKVVIRSKQALAALRIYKNVLVMETMKYPDEVRSQLEVPGIEKELAVEERELNMATQLVEGMTADFAPEKYTDEYRKALLDLIQAKLAGEQPAPSAVPPVEGVVDLMESLRASLEAIEKEKFTPAPPEKAKKRGRVG
ncbi:MAG: Ku protein [Eubacteriales bacterium]|nr:Ku protein [Eubacteriales bacterium]MDD3073095.1 Ku protein [Eubacteriales bacterium]MDD4078896.1 Ku protein [Eubacteriales bacterium]MDD4768406.1 Ku protein [Eubacteriales bacterium]